MIKNKFGGATRHVVLAIIASTGIFITHDGLSFGLKGNSEPNTLNHEQFARFKFCPTFETTLLESAFRQENTTLSLAVAMHSGIFLIDKNFDPIETAVVANFTDYLDAFVGVRNRDEFELIRDNICRKILDKMQLR